MQQDGLPVAAILYIYTLTALANGKEQMKKLGGELNSNLHRLQLISLIALNQHFFPCLRSKTLENQTKIMEIQILLNLHCLQADNRGVKSKTSRVW